MTQLQLHQADSQVTSTQEVFLFVKIPFFVQIFFPTIEKSENLAWLGSLYAYQNTHGGDFGSLVVKLTRLYVLVKGGLIYAVILGSENMEEKKKIEPKKKTTKNKTKKNHNQSQQ